VGRYLHQQLSHNRTAQRVLLGSTLLMTAMVLGDGVLTPAISGARAGCVRVHARTLQGQARRAPAATQQTRVHAALSATPCARPSPRVGAAPQCCPP
jgi:hypothetical protein